MNDQLVWTTAGVGSIWLAVTMVSIFAPDMVTGSQQEHIPVAAFLTWISGAVATRALLNEVVRRREPTTEDEYVWKGIAVVTGVIWLAVTLVSILVPQAVTGTNPTRIPLAAILAPTGGAIATGVAGQYMVLLAPTAKVARKEAAQ